MMLLSASRLTAVRMCIYYCEKGQLFLFHYSGFQASCHIDLKAAGRCVSYEVCVVSDNQFGKKGMQTINISLNFLIFLTTSNM
jgi:hypothetical protein